jgi:hypothetical protein
LINTQGAFSVIILTLNERLKISKLIFSCREEEDIFDVLDIKYCHILMSIGEHNLLLSLGILMKVFN